MIYKKFLVIIIKYKININYSKYNNINIIYYKLKYFMI